MAQRTIKNDLDYRFTTQPGISLVIAVTVIASLPFILGMVIWLPAWLEQSGLSTASAVTF